MLNAYEPERKPMSRNRKLWLGFSAAALILLGYVGWIFYSRWHENHAINQELTAQRQEKEQQNAAATVESLGGSEFKIISFYASPGEIHRGDEVTMCYGVSNAKSVSVDPSVGEVWPSVSRCLQTSPKKTTKYTFTADDGKGSTKTAELTIVVK
jgi:cytoskeletal protein RodZ